MMWLAVETDSWPPKSVYLPASVQLAVVMWLSFDSLNDGTLGESYFQVC